MLHHQIKRVLLLLILSTIIVCPTISIAKTMDAIVKVFVTSQTYNYDTPWQVDSIEQSSGSAAIISGERILTNAHVVSNATYIEVQRYGDADKKTAKVIAVSHQSDLAILSVDDKSFFSGITPLNFGPLPEILDDVVVYGFPEGGEGLSVTKGVVSRIEVIEYVHSSLQMLALQIDAAINSGNSGGPVIQNGHIIGVAMQSRKDAENIGYIIPTPIIKHFLEDLKDGQHDGFPEDGVYIQELRNSALRKSLSIPSEETGALVTRVVPGTSADGYLHQGDVILEIDGHPLANDGTVLLRPGLRVSSSYLTSDRQLGDTVNMTIRRGGAKQSISFPLTTRYGSAELVKIPQYDVRPEYVIIAGILFTPLTYNYLTTWGKSWVRDAPIKLLKHYIAKRQKAGEEVVIINGFLSSAMTVGYQDMATDRRVKKINGKDFASFSEFIELVDTALEQNSLLTFEIERGAILVVSSQQHRIQEHELLEIYGITVPRYSRIQNIQ